MFTVILLSSAAHARLRRWASLFDPFQDSVQFCEWNQSTMANTLSAAAPGLADIISGHREWRAIVVDTAVEDGRVLPDPENPFDYEAGDQSGFPADQLRLDHSPHPMVRLSHMLLGYPEMGAKGFVPRVSYWNPDTGTRVYAESPDQSESDGVVSDAMAQYQARLIANTDVQVHYGELQHTQQEWDRYRDMTDHYRIRHPRPAEVIFMATRIPVETDPTGDVRKAWGEGIDTGPSRFVERNDYSPSCRFVVCPLPAPGHSSFESEELNFWLSVLTLATSSLPASSLQAERLYRVTLEVNSDLLAQMLNEHLSHMAAARDLLARRIKRPDPPDYRTVSEVLQQHHIPIDFQDLDASEVKVSGSGFSLAPDSTSQEFGLWHERVASLRSHIDSYVRRPRRVLARTVTETREQTAAFLGEPRILSEIDRDELVEEITKRTARLAQPATVDILDRRRLAAVVNDYDGRMRKVLAARMSRGTVSVAGGVVALAWLTALAPYVVHSGFIGLNEATDAWIAVAAIGAFLMGIGLTALVLMRRRVIALARRMNLALISFTTRVKSGAAAFSSYLSDLVTYMQGQAILLASSEHDETMHSARRQAEVALRSINDRMNREKSIVLELGHTPQIQASSPATVPLDPNDWQSWSHIFQWPIGTRAAALNSSGETIAAPYDFLARINVSDLRLREHDGLMRRTRSRTTEDTM